MPRLASIRSIACYNIIFYAQNAQIVTMNIRLTNVLRKSAILMPF